MNNKLKYGFTLIELIVVIAIMSLLVLVVTPAITNMRDDILEKTYQSKVRSINNAAKDWASENLIYVPSVVNNEYDEDRDTSCDDNCVCVTINELIVKGFLVGDKEGKSIMTNPITNEPMNDELVCSRYNTNNIETRKIITYIVED